MIRPLYKKPLPFIEISHLLQSLKDVETGIIIYNNLKSYAFNSLLLQQVSSDLNLLIYISSRLEKSLGENGLKKLLSNTLGIDDFKIIPIPGSDRNFCLV
jgi:hypothetical protein